MSENQIFNIIYLNIIYFKFISNISFLKGWAIYEPYTLLDIDIGTNKGLGEVLMWLSDKHKDENLNIIMDENIFYRILKVYLFLLIFCYYTYFILFSMVEVLQN